MLLEIKNVFKQVTEPSGEIITVSHAEHLMLPFRQRQNYSSAYDCRASYAKRRRNLF